MNSRREMSLPPAVFRTDASVAGGLGHLMRCRALAAEWTVRGGLAMFVTTKTQDDLLELVRKDGCRVKVGPLGASVQTEPAWLVPWLKEMSHPVLFLDGYDFDLEYQREVRPWVRCLVCLDDVPARRFECDVVLNQNLGVAVQDYEPLVSPGTTVLVGPRYTLLRGDYREHAGGYQLSEQPARVLVTLGGADRADHTALVLRELATVPGIEMDVILGPLYPHLDPVDRIEGLTAGRIQVHRGLDRFLDLARHADLAVTAGGSTVWELACLGIPMVVLGTADNQDAVLKGLRDEGAALVLGRVESLALGEIAGAVCSLLAASSRLQGLSQAAARLVDGRGVQRVIEVVEGIAARSMSLPGAPAGLVKS